MYLGLDALLLGGAPPALAGDAAAAALATAYGNCSRYAGLLGDAGKDVVPVGLEFAHVLKKGRHIPPRSHGDGMQGWCQAELLAKQAKRRVPPGRRNVVWLHLHNMAGTMICQEALRQGEQVQWMVDCRWGVEDCFQLEHNVGCETKAQSTDITFSMLERPVQPQDFCQPKVLMGTILRDPVATMETAWRVHSFNMESILSTLRTGALTEQEKAHPCLPAWDHFHHFDNFATRSLSGMYLVPPQGVTQQHLEVGLYVLRSMDVVLVLEDLKDNMAQLSATFGWDLSLLDPDKPVKSLGSDTAKEEKNFDQETAAYLTRVNQWDYALYRYARQRANELTQQAASAAR